jgi:hypothetical protein
MKIQNPNEYGIKIKYHRRYLMLILHTISQCIIKCYIAEKSRAVAMVTTFAFTK